MKQLKVILLEEEIGLLEQNSNGKLSFRYHKHWVSHKKSRPLSQSLPLRLEKFNEKECTPFFGGLLPEEHIRETIARNLGITPRNDYAMLREIGGECSGAISLMPTDEARIQAIHDYEIISEKELIHILDQLPQKPLLAGNAEIRLSLAGAQNKVALRLNESGYAIPLHESPSTHILKPEPDRFPGLADNEAYCLKLASAVGLNVCEADIRNYGSHRCLLVTRYDRIIHNDVIHRLHQEDFCQALGISSRTKYQNEGGPGLKQCFELVRRTSASPSKDLIQLFNGVIFNHLIGNHDAHGKNFSLLYSAPKERYALRLAPFYDLISTSIYPELTTQMAMKIGKASKSAEIQRSDWEIYWEKISFSQKQARKFTLQLVDQVEALLGAPDTPIQEKIHALILEKSSKLKELLS